MSSHGSLEDLAQALARFAQERAWEPFHTPKNLAMGLGIEAAEVLEVFQWLTPEESRGLSEQQRGALADEIGDVLIYLVMLSRQCGVDPLEAAWNKLEKNGKRYPVALARGRAVKSDLPE